MHQSFHELVPLSLLRTSGLTAHELGLLLNGQPDVDVDTLRAHAIYQSSDLTSFNEEHPSRVWFWQMLLELPAEDKQLVLQFITGSARVPLDGFEPPLTITEGEGMEQDSLPRAHTCFNQVVIPSYSSFHKMCDRFTFAVKNTATFEMA